MSNRPTWCRLESTDAAHFGGKAAGLSLLLRIPHVCDLVPEGLAFDPDVSQPQAFWNNVAELANGGLLAIRSSADIEDSAEASAAGVFQSVLDVNYLNAGAFTDAVKTCCSALRSDVVKRYCGNKPVKLFLIVQRMIQGKYSGVVFTDDPDLSPGKPQRMVVSWDFGTGGVTHGDGSEFFVTPEAEMAEIPSGLVPLPLLATFGKVDSLRRFNDLNVWQILRKEFGPVDVEWVIDKHDALWLTQARPIMFPTPAESRPLDRGAFLKGAGVGLSASFTGVVHKLNFPWEYQDKMRGGILVVDDTNPKWESCLPNFGALITDHGCRTSHAAIMAREIGIPAVVGTLTATQVLNSGDQVTVKVEDGQGFVA